MISSLKKHAETFKILSWNCLIFVLPFRETIQIKWSFSILCQHHLTYWNSLTNNCCNFKHVGLRLAGSFTVIAETGRDWAVMISSRKITDAKSLFLKNYFRKLYRLYYFFPGTVSYRKMTDLWKDVLTIVRTGSGMICSVNIYCCQLCSYFFQSTTCRRFVWWHDKALCLLKHD